MIKELLNDIVAKQIFHELNCIWLDLSEDSVFLVTVGAVDLRLHEPGALLVSAELDDMAINLTESELLPVPLAIAEVVENGAATFPTGVGSLIWLYGDSSRVSGRQIR
jgi:hypothetical protein